MSKTKRQLITKNEYYQLLGLLLIAQNHNKAIQEVLTAMLSITKEEAQFGHTADTVWDIDGTIDELLEKLQLKVEE